MWGKPCLFLAAQSTVAALLVSAGPANVQGTEFVHHHARRTMFAHLMVTNQDHQSDDASGELKIGRLRERDPAGAGVRYRRIRAARGRLDEPGLLRTLFVGDL
jgi:hypothetical protein